MSAFTAYTTCIAKLRELDTARADLERAEQRHARAVAARMSTRTIAERESDVSIARELVELAHNEHKAASDAYDQAHKQALRDQRKARAAFNAQRWDNPKRLREMAELERIAEFNANK